MTADLLHSSLCLPRWGAMALALTAAAAAPRAGRAQEQGAGKTATNIASSNSPAPQYWLGVAVENIPSSFARQMKLRADQGLMVVGVIPQTPAEKAGLKADDLLIEINGSALVSQEQLSRAANAVAGMPGQKGKGNDPVMEGCDLVFLRDGDRQSVRVVPQLRPGNFVVSGVNLQNFTINGGNTAASTNKDVKNLVLPNGAGVQVGPGYRVDLNSDLATSSIIREAVKDGQTVVMSQETDSNGNVKNTISTNGRTFSIPDDMDKLPVSLQPLAQQFQANGLRHMKGGNSPQAAPANNKGGDSAGGGNSQMVIENKESPAADQQKQIQQLLEQNQRLQQQIDALTKTINESLRRRLTDGG